MSTHAQSQAASDPIPPFIIATWDQERPWDVNVTKHPSGTIEKELSSASNHGRSHCGFENPQSALCVELSDPKVLEEFFQESEVPAESWREEYQQKYKGAVKLDDRQSLTLYTTKQPTQPISDNEATQRRARYWVDHPEKQANGWFGHSNVYWPMNPTKGSHPSWNTPPYDSEFWFYSDDAKGKINAMLFRWHKEDGGSKTTVTTKLTRAPPRTGLRTDHLAEHDPVQEGTTIRSIDLYSHEPQHQKEKK